MTVGNMLLSPIHVMILFIFNVFAACNAPSLALNYAAMKGDIKTAKIILACRVDPDSSFLGLGETPLHHAHDTEMAQLLIDWGADVNARDGYGRTPLHLTDSAKVAQLLVDNGAHFDEGIATRMLHDEHHPDKIRFLIENGADVNDRDINGQTTLFNLKNRRKAEALIRHGADVNMKDNFGSTPLHGAPDRCIGILIKNGAHVNARDNNGDTPLHWTARAGYSNSVRRAGLLIKYGADVNVENNKGETPLSIAIGEKNSDMANFLKQSGARR